MSGDDVLSKPGNAPLRTASGSGVSVRREWDDDVILCQKEQDTLEGTVQKLQANFDYTELAN